MAGAPHLDAFLNAARSFIGLRESKSNRFPASDPRGAELWKLWGSNASGTSWCAIFVSACGVKAGVSGSVIGKNAGASGIAKATVKQTANILQSIVTSVSGIAVQLKVQYFFTFVCYLRFAITVSIQ
jgi:hypothetical protein